MKSLIALLILATPLSAKAAGVCSSNLLITLDRSCSMQDAPNGQTVGPNNPSKWTIAGTVIQNLTTTYSAKLRFGLIMFPDQTGQNCVQDGAIYVNVGDNKGPMVASTIMGTQPTGPCVTPIDTAVTQVAMDPEYMAQSPQPGRRGFVLLLTDGMQAGCGTVTQKNAEIMQTISRLYSHGYATYVVGFGGQVDGAALDSFAMAGGVPNSGTPKYYKADTAAQLDAAIQAIAGRIGGDEFSCAGTPCPDNRCFGHGETCSNGTCVGGTGTGGSSGGSGGASGGSSGGGNPNGTTGDAGCGCRVGGKSVTFGPLGIALAVLAWCVRRRHTR
jgi:hypothetical protein